MRAGIINEHECIYCILFNNYVYWRWLIPYGHHQNLINLLQRSDLHGGKHKNGSIQCWMFWKTATKTEMANEGQKGHQRPELQKIFDFIDIQCKIIHKWECNTLRKICEWVITKPLYALYQTQLLNRPCSYLIPVVVVVDVVVVVVLVVNPRNLVAVVVVVVVVVVGFGKHSHICKYYKIS